MVKILQNIVYLIRASVVMIRTAAGRMGRDYTFSSNAITENCLSNAAK